MKPAAGSSDAVPEGKHRRGVRLFVALHLGAVGTIYAAAVTVGGGFTGAPLPPLTVGMANPKPTPASPAPSVAVPGAQTVTPSSMPEWTRRLEIAAPWESH